jgi:hypothetical protein
MAASLFKLVLVLTLCFIIFNLGRALVVMVKGDSDEHHQKDKKPPNKNTRPKTLPVSRFCTVTSAPTAIKNRAIAPTMGQILWDGT